MGEVVVGGLLLWFFKGCYRVDSGEFGLTPTPGVVSSPLWRRQGWVEGRVNKCCEEVGVQGQGTGEPQPLFFFFLFFFFFFSFNFMD